MPAPNATTTGLRYSQQNVLNPDVYPMNWTWVTGRITDEQMRHEHAAEWERKAGLKDVSVLAAAYRSLTWQGLSESVFLTARTSAMVCWLFVGSATFASIFAYLGGNQIITITFTTVFFKFSIITCEEFRCFTFK